MTKMFYNTLPGLIYLVLVSASLVYRYSFSTSLKRVSPPPSSHTDTHTNPATYHTLLLVTYVEPSEMSMNNFSAKIEAQLGGQPEK